MAAFLAARDAAGEQSCLERQLLHMVVWKIQSQAQGSHERLLRPARAVEKCFSQKCVLKNIRRLTGSCTCRHSLDALGLHGADELREVVGIRGITLRSGHLRGSITE